jgi:preprotein translocase subunit YajC
MLNLAALRVGETVVLKGGIRAEVVDNPEDGMWIAVRRLRPDGAAEEEEELVHADQVVDRG